MVRIVILVAILIVVFRWVTGRWPWYYLRQTRSAPDPVDRARMLLGVGKNASPADIRAAHRRRVTQIHPDRGGSAQDVHEADAARDLLLAQTKERLP